MPVTVNSDSTFCAATTTTTMRMSCRDFRSYLDENEIREFEIEDADGTGVSVWVPPATLRDDPATHAPSRLSCALRRASRVGGQRRAYFAEQRSFSCEAAASSAPAAGTAAQVRGVAVGRRYAARETVMRLVRQPKTEAAPDAPADVSATSRRRDKPTTTADSEPGVAYRPRHHQAPDSEHAAGGRGYVDFDPRGATAGTGGVGGRYIGAERSRKSVLERHSSMVSGVEERDAEVTAAASSARRHTTGQVPDHRHHDPGLAVTKTAVATESKHYGRAPPADTAYLPDRGRVLMADVDKGAGTDRRDYS